MNRVSHPHRRLGWLLALVFASTTIIPAAHAGLAQVGVRAFARDLPLSGEQSAIGAIDSPTATATATYTAGLATAFVHADANAFTGAIHANYLTDVGSAGTSFGRSAFVDGRAGMTGSITLSDGYPPGLATFSAILEGSYSFGRPTLDNAISLDYSLVIGDGSGWLDRIDFDPFTSTGVFSIPMTMTQMVHPGDRINMLFSMRGTISGGVGINTLDVSNTFKLTEIDLPPGYTFTSDADGFLSQFNNTSEPPPLSPVPEPATTGLMGAAALAGIVLTRYRRRRTRVSA